MKRQGRNDRLDEALAMRHRGHHMQTLADRRHESRAMSEADRKRSHHKKKYHQTRKDRMHEAEGMRRHERKRK